MSEIRKKEHAYKGAETSSTNAIPAGWEALLVAEIKQSSTHSKNEASGFVDGVITAESQMDALMISRSVDGLTLMTITADADIPLMARDHCIAMKEFAIDGKITIVSTSKATLEIATSYLSQKDKEHITFVPAKFSLFENANDQKLQALMALYLGCDV